MDLSIVIPIYNEESNIQLLYDRLRQVVQEMQVSYEMIFVNDGSQDRSLEMIQDLSVKDARVKFIDFSRNFGHQIAVTAGLDHTQGEAVVIIDADLQDPPELIKDLYEKMKEGYEVVYARRRRRKGESVLKRFTASIFYRLLSRITSINIPLDTGDFRIIHRKVVEQLRKMPEQHKFLRGQIAWIGFRQTFVEYDRDERHGGETGYTYAKMIRFAIDGITSFSDFPLKVTTWVGFFCSGIAFLLILYALGSWLFQDETVYERGWASLMVSILFIGGIMLIGIGVIGEYISRLSQNIRQRPLYVINETNAADASPKPQPEAPSTS